MPHLPEGRVSTQIIWNSPAWEIYLFSLIYLIIQLFIHSSMDLWIFILYFGYNPLLLHLFCYSHCGSFGHCELYLLASLT